MKEKDVVKQDHKNVYMYNIIQTRHIQ